MRCSLARVGHRVYLQKPQEEPKRHSSRLGKGLGRKLQIRFAPESMRSSCNKDSVYANKINEWDGKLGNCFHCQGSLVPSNFYLPQHLSKCHVVSRPLSDLCYWYFDFCGDQRDVCIYPANTLCQKRINIPERERMWCLYISCQYIVPKRINIPEREREKVVSGNYVRATLVFSCQLSHVHSPLLYKTQIQNLPKYRKFALVFSELFCFQRNRYQTVCELFSVPAKSTKKQQTNIAQNLQNATFPMSILVSSTTKSSF